MPRKYKKYAKSDFPTAREIPVRTLRDRGDSIPLPVPDEGTDSFNLEPTHQIESVDPMDIDFIGEVSSHQVTNHDIDHQSDETSEVSLDDESPSEYCPSDISADNTSSNMEDVSSDSSGSDEEQIDIPNMQLPIYDSCALTPNQSALLLMASALRFKASDCQVDANLRIVDLHLPFRIHKSKYRFFKAVPDPDFEKCYYAPDCYCSLTFEGESNISTCGCERQATHSKRDLDKSGSFFFYLPLRPQLEKLVKSKAYYHARREVSGESDVINGSLYRELLGRGIIKKDDITLQLNTDGVSLFNWSKTSLWPIQVLVNELPYYMRKNHIMLCGLWFHEKKPPMKLYLSPLIRELKTLSEDGFTTVTSTSNVPVLIKVHTLLLSVDTIARPLVQNINQFNGKNGCSFCLNPGRKLKLPGNVHVYCGTKFNIRTLDQYRRWVRAAERTKKTVKGIKGPSPMSKLPHFDVLHDCPADYLHAILEGVVKLLLKLWFSSKFHQQKWYLGRFKKQINEIIRIISPPCGIKRILRPIEHIKWWTAAELKYFLFYYSIPCLIHFLPKKYLTHFSLLLWSIHTLSQKHIPESDLVKVEKALIKFVEEFQKLYGEASMVYNVHLLLHLVQNVRRFGALWAWSNFPFESFNGLLKTLYKGTQCVPDQIIKVYNRLAYIQQNKNEFTQGQCNEAAKKELTHLLKECHVSLDFDYDDELKTFGKPQNKELTLIEKNLIENLYQFDLREQQGTIFLRFVYKNILYHSKNYKRMSKRINSVIGTVGGQFINITHLMSLTLPNPRYIIFGHVLRVIDAEVFKSQGLSSNKICRVVKETDDIICCSLEDIGTKCFLSPFFKQGTKVERKFYVFPLVNQIEKD